MIFNRTLVSLFLILHIGSPLFAKPVVGIAADNVSDTEHGKLYVLSIGVSQFQDPFWTKLKWTGTDAAAFASALGSEGPNGPSVTVLKETASLAAVIEALNNLEKRVAANDRVVVYLSTHGTLQLNENVLEPFFVFFDTKADRLKDTGLSRRALIARIESMRARKKLLILASCHSGFGKSRLSDEVERFLGQHKGETIALEEVSHGMMVLTAASQSETAREDNHLKSDVYTHYFLQALFSYDRNGDGAVSALEAHDYAKQRTFEYTRGRQRPTMHVQAVGNGDLILRGNGGGKPSIPILQAYQDIYAGLSLGVNGAAKGALPNAFPLKPGPNRIKIYGPGDTEAFAEYEMQVDNNENFDLEELVRVPPYRLSAHLGDMYLIDATAREKLGSSHPVLGIGAHLRWSSLDGGIVISSVRGRDMTLREQLTLNHTRLMIAAPLRYGLHPTQSLYTAFGGVVAYERMQLIFTDESRSKSLQVADTNLGYGLNIECTYEFRFGLSIGGDVQYVRSAFDFGEFGAIKGDYIAAHAIAAFVFGAKARRIK